MTAEIMAVGTELLLGDIVNTNAQYLSRQLAGLGIGVYYQSVVGDNPERLLNALETAFGRADLVITTGGLGPTDDDLTKEMGAKFFKREMVLDESCLKTLKDYFKDKDMPETNMKQAYIPEGAVVIKNDNGTAPACMIEDNGKTLIMLPGPPNEVVPIFENEVLPILKEKCDKTFVSKELHLSGIGEAAGAEAIRELMQNSQNPTIAPYAKTNEMMFRVTASGENEDECRRIMKPVVDEIYDRLGEYIYGEDNETLVGAVIKLLKSKGMTIATAESCTGGMVASNIVNCSGASTVFVNGMVTYSNESKKRLLGVKPETLEKYGAVSEETAREMCEGVADVSGTNVGLSTTGIAGPDGGTEEKPVGLVYIGVHINGETTVKRLELKGSREKIRSRASTEVIELLRQLLRK